MSERLKQWLADPVPWGVFLLAGVSVGILFAGGFWVYSRVQVARVEAIERICLRFNDNARQNIRFIARSAPRLTATAVRFYKVEPNCHAYAVRVGRMPTPQPGAPSR